MAANKLNIDLESAIISNMDRFWPLWMASSLWPFRWQMLFVKYKIDPISKCFKIILLGFSILKFH